MLNRGVVSPARVSVALDDELEFACFLVDAKERVERAASATYCWIMVSGSRNPTRDETRLTYQQQV